MQFLVACAIGLGMGLWYWLESRRDERPYEIPDPMGRGVIHRYLSDDFEVLYDHQGNFVEILTWPRPPLVTAGVFEEDDRDDDDWRHQRLM